MDKELEGEPIIVECCGSIVKAVKTTKGFYVCPICEEAIFFNEHDLLRHIVSHALDLLKYRHRIPKFRK